MGIKAGPAAQQVNHPDKGILFADGQLDGDRIGLQAAFYRIDGTGITGPHPIHLVDETDARHHIGIGLPPHRFRLGLHPGHGVQYHNAAVQHPQAALHLGGKIHMARGVNDVDPVVVPLGGGGGGGNGNAPFPFLGHPVHGRSSLVHSADLMDPAGQKQRPFRNGGFAGVDVGDEPDIANFLDGISRNHDVGLGPSPPFAVSL